MSVASFTRRFGDAVTKVAVRYGISDIAIRKICKQLAEPPPVHGDEMLYFHMLYAYSI